MRGLRSTIASGRRPRRPAARTSTSSRGRQPDEPAGPRSRRRSSRRSRPTRSKSSRSRPSRATPRRSRRTRTAWQLAEPVAAAASETEVSGITSALGAARDRARHRREPGRPERLRPRRRRASRSTSRRRATRTTARSSSARRRRPGGDLFAKRNGEDKVFLIAAFQEPTFNRATFDLRDKTALHVRSRQGRRHRRSTPAARRSSSPRTAATGRSRSRSRPRRTSSAVEGLIGRLQSAQMKIDRVRRPDARRSEEVRPRQAGGDRHAGPGQRHARRS